MWIQRVSETMHARPGLGLLIAGGCIAVAAADQFAAGTAMAFMMFYPAIMLVAFFAGRTIGYISVAASAASGSGADGAGGAGGAASTSGTGQ